LFAALQNTLIVDWRLNFLESTFCKHSNDFHFKHDPKLEGVAAAKASLCEGKALSET